jgi:hypothetical protein
MPPPKKPKLFAPIIEGIELKIGDMVFAVVRGAIKECQVTKANDWLSGHDRWGAVTLLGADHPMWTHAGNIKKLNRKADVTDQLPPEAVLNADGEIVGRDGQRITREALIPKLFKGALLLNKVFSKDGRKAEMVYTHPKGVARSLTQGLSALVKQYDKARTLDHFTQIITKANKLKLLAQSVMEPEELAQLQYGLSVKFLPRMVILTNKAIMARAKIKKETRV